MSQGVRYVMLPQMVIHNFNAESNQYVVGIPAMTAFTGYAHSLERAMQVAGWLVSVEGIAVLLHDLRVHEGHPKCPSAMQGAKEFINPPIIEEIKGDMRVTLVLRLVWDKPARAWVKDRFDDGHPDLLRDLSGWVFRLPCCGGSCHDVGQIRLLHSQQQDDSGEYPLQTALQTVLRQDRAFVIQSRADLLQEAQSLGQDALDALFDAMRVLRDEHGQWQRQQSGWIVPLAVGYQAIEMPQQRGGARDGARHVYAEPLTSIGELVYAAHWLWQADFAFERVFWVHRHDAQQQTYFVTTLETEE